MKNTLALLFIFFATGISAQQYHLIHNHLPSYYSEYEIKTFAVDSMEIVGNLNIYYLATSIRVIPNNECLMNHAGMYIGKELIESNHKTTILNYNGDSIYYYHNTLPGQSNIFFEYPNSGNHLIITHNHTVYEEFLGISDSVKYFTIQAFDQNSDSLDHDFNGLVFGLSRNYGLITTIDNYLFPATYATTYEISGFSGAETGVSNIDWHDIYSINIDDEFHISEQFKRFEQINDTVVEVTSFIKKIRKVIDLIDYQDSIRFTFIECWQVIKRSSVLTDTIYISDTLIEETIGNIAGFYWMNTSPGQYYGSGFSFSMITQDYPNSYSYNYRQLKTITYDYVEFWDDCLTYSIICPSHIIHSYIEGCGGPYYNYPSIFNYPKRQLEYYKKGTEEWGVPFASSCESLISEIENNIEKSHNILIYPNPFTESLQIENLSNDYKLTVYDIKGNIITNSSGNQENAKINMSTYPKGLYIVNIAFINGMVVTKKVIKK